MIIMLNGSFGVGKTTTARALVARLPYATLYDPEMVGTVVRVLTNGRRRGAEDTDDFQDIVLWRTLTIRFAAQLKHWSRRTLVVPMTLAHLAYFVQIRDGLMQIDANVHHFCLTAALPTIQARLVQRGDEPGSWPWRKASTCVPALDDPQFRTHINTEGQTVQHVVDTILEHLMRHRTERVVAR